MLRRFNTTIVVTIAATVLILSAFTSPSPRAQAQKGTGSRLTEAEAIKLQKRLFDGMIAHDLKGLAAILDKDLIYIHINGDKQISRDEFLAWVDKGPKFETFDLIEPHVFLYDGAMALTGRVESTSKTVSKGPDGTPRNQDTVLHLILSTVWAQKPEGWQLVLLQYTQIPNK
jgi:hypothetical protein